MKELYAYIIDLVTTQLGDVTVIVAKDKQKLNRMIIDFDLAQIELTERDTNVDGVHVLKIVPPKGN